MNRIAYINFNITIFVRKKNSLIKHPKGCILGCSMRKISVNSRQKLLIELWAVATLIEIKNLLEFFVSDKPEPGNTSFF